MEPWLLHSVLLLLLLLPLWMMAQFPSPSLASCAPHSCKLLDSCSTSDDCGAGLYCGSCPATGNAQPFCIRNQVNQPTAFVKGLPFNRYTWLVTHNSYSIIDDEPSYTSLEKKTFFNQEDTVANQLRNGVRGLMLDMYDFNNDIWLCHSFEGQCYDLTAFDPAINTLKEVEAFLAENPSEIVTIMIEDYVHAPKGLTKLFKEAGLDKYWYPVSRMPKSGKHWPTVTYMVAKNQRLVVFTSDSSKEASEGIAYQWRYMLENEPGDPGIVLGSCTNRKESQPLNSRYASLFLQNYFPTDPLQNEACKEHSLGLAEMVDACYKAAGDLKPTFLAVNFYMRSNGKGIFEIQDSMNGLWLCGCSTITACQDGAPMGICKNITPPSQTPNGSIDSGNVPLPGSMSVLHASGPCIILLIVALSLSFLL